MKRYAKTGMSLALTMVALSIAALACTAAPSGNEIQTKAGQQFTIKLESNPTTGYGWELAQPLDESILQFVKSDYQAPQNGRIGQGGEEVWTFKAVGKGTTQIAMKYVRSWEQDKPPADTRDYKVVVK